MPNNTHCVQSSAPRQATQKLILAGAGHPVSLPPHHAPLGYGGNACQPRRTTSPSRQLQVPVPLENVACNCDVVKAPQQGKLLLELIDSSEELTDTSLRLDDDSGEELSELSEPDGTPKEGDSEEDSDTSEGKLAALSSEDADSDTSEEKDASCEEDGDSDTDGKEAASDELGDPEADSEGKPKKASDKDDDSDPAADASDISDLSEESELNDDAVVQQIRDVANRGKVPSNPAYEPTRRAL